MPDKPYTQDDVERVRLALDPAARDSFTSAGIATAALNALFSTGLWLRLEREEAEALSASLNGIDGATRYYVIARYSYGYADVDFDEANNLARTAGLELSDLGQGAVPLAKVGRGKVTLHDFEDRGDERLGLAPDANGTRPLIDVLHGLLWRAAHDNRSLRAYLDEARPDPEALRDVAQALQGHGLHDGNAAKPREAQACERLLGAWRTLVDENLLTGA